MTRHRILIVAGALVLVTGALGGIAAGGSTRDNTHGIGDARIGHYAQPLWDVTNAPDGYPNVATVCSPYVDGKRIWIVTHRTSDYQPVISQDEGCHADPTLWKTVTP